MRPATEKEDDEDEEDILTSEEQGGFLQTRSVCTLVLVLETRTVYLEQKISHVFYFLRYFLIALDITIRTTKHTTTPATTIKT